MAEPISRDYPNRPFTAALAICRRGGKKLDRKAVPHQMFTLDLPALRLQVRINIRNACGQSFVGRNKENIGIVRGKRLNIIYCRQGAAKRPAFNQFCG